MTALVRCALAEVCTVLVLLVFFDWFNFSLFSVPSVTAQQTACERFEFFGRGLAVADESG